MQIIPRGVSIWKAGDPVLDNHNVEEIIKAHELLVDGTYRYFEVWKDHILFSWRWWVLLFIAVMSWIIWVVFHQKESSDRLLYVGLFVVLISSWLDFLGVMFNLWYYTADLIPSNPGFISFDFCVLPVFAMLLIQWKPQASPFLKALLFGGVNAFIGEYLLIWMDIYKPSHWHPMYFFPILSGIYWISYVISTRNRFRPLT